MDGDRGCAMGRIEQMIRYAVWSSGLEQIVIGISGGIDSAVAAAFCCRALGGGRVLGLTLPAAVTPQEDITDSRLLCSKLGMDHRVISIEPILDAYRGLPGFTQSPYLLGNLMARTRMAILYYHANRDGRLVCGTSNRTEYLLGYCTKYGDDAADIQPILHLYKTEVYEYAHDLGIPEPIIRKPPSAGLWVGQQDESEIGLAYPEIDAALRSLSHNGWKSSNPIEEKILSLVKASEHKRLPAPTLLGTD
ncbi:MAG TPA: NAD+ synthase [Methanoregulaceae archaeon]|nr:MAG: NAD+ synthase [Methanolinea sp.]HON81551.1 NAD+ synthase [Methanoregulaceae archaeon]HPD10358.1 NAD+ synthase [Methanoregulaceae archaeon]HRT15413.1 NAD+ synthase [Methanoregulaceae archaeon]HRU30886.1 NAD+ synthase [Methanoregulaceae archaeon]